MKLKGNGRDGVWSTVVTVLRETSKTKAIVRRGLPKITRYNEVVYQLKCGHEVTRSRPRSSPTIEGGHSLKCDTCTHDKLVRALVEARVEVEYPMTPEESAGLKALMAEGERRYLAQKEPSHEA